MNVRAFVASHLPGRPRRRLLAALAVAPLALAAQAQAQVPTLRVLAWPGYADADLVTRFEKLASARVEVTTVDTDDDLREQLQRGGVDVFAANTAEIERLLAAERLAPLRLAAIPAAGKLLPRFADRAAIPGIARAGQTYALPFTYAEMGLIYDRRQLAQPPTSLAVLWDPRLRRRVLAYDGSTHNFSIAAQTLGIDPFRIPPQAFGRVAQRLVELRRNVLAFYSQPDESVELFRRHGIAVLFANYGSQQLKPLRDAGLDVGYVIPREGALAWLDCWAIPLGANRDLAERWIDFALDSANAREFTRRHGLANTVEASTAPPVDGRLIWLQPVEDDARRAALWRRIVSGERVVDTSR